MAFVDIAGFNEFTDSASESGKTELFPLNLAEILIFLKYPAFPATETRCPLKQVGMETSVLLSCGWVWLVSIQEK